MELLELECPFLPDLSITGASKIIVIIITLLSTFTKHSYMNNSLNLLMFKGIKGAPYQTNQQNLWSHI